MRIDNETVRAAQGGDREALTRIVECYRHMVFSRCLTLLKDQDAAEDAAQETWLKVVRHIAGFQHGSELSTWIFTIATNESLMQMRRNKSRAALSLEEPTADVDGEELTLGKSIEAHDRALELTPEKIDLEQALRNISPVLRTSVLMFDCGYSHRETAQVLGVSEGTIKSRVKRGRDTLKKAMAMAAGTGK